MRTPLFRSIPDDQKEEAYFIICQRTAWLKSKGIRQWTEPLEYDEFQQRHERGENFGLFLDGRLTVFLSLLKLCHNYWQVETRGNEEWWLETLTSAIEFSGQDLGQIAVRDAINYLADKGAQQLYLDCVHGIGFLPAYYQRLGFQVVAAKNIDFPKCGPTDMVLMRRDIVTG